MSISSGRGVANLSGKQQRNFRNLEIFRNFKVPLLVVANKITKKPCLECLFFHFM